MSAPAMGHTDHAFESELAEVRDHVLLMGAHVEGLISASMRALVERDSDLSHATLESDREIDELELSSTSCACGCSRGASPSRPTFGSSRRR